MYVVLQTTRHLGDSEFKHHCCNRRFRMWKIVEGDGSVKREKLGKSQQRGYLDSGWLLMMNKNSRYKLKLKLKYFQSHLFFMNFIGIIRFQLSAYVSKLLLILCRTALYNSKR